MVPVPRQDCSYVAVRGRRDGERAEGLRICRRLLRKRSAQCPRRAGADAPVTAQRRVRFADDDLRDEDRLPSLAGADDVFDGPPVMAVTPIDRGDDHAADGDRAQLP